MNDSEILLNIREWMAKKKIEELTCQALNKTLESYKIDEPTEYLNYFGEGTLENEFLMLIDSISIRYANYPDYNYNHIVVSVPIRHKNTQIGHYQVYFNFDGTIDDDSLEMY